MSKIKLSIAVLFIFSVFGSVALAESQWLNCWQGGGDEPVWDRCEDLCNDRGEYCQTVWPHKSYCSDGICFVDFWMVCTDGYHRIYYDANTGHSDICSGQ